MSTSPSPLEVQRYFNLLYPDPPDDAWLVVSWRAPRDPEAPLKSQWVRFAEAVRLIVGIEQNAAKVDIWLGIGLRHPNCTPAPERRGTSEEVYAIPGLWVDLDHTGGTHVARNLPTPQELLAFIEALPVSFSLIVDTSGGYHGYVLFKELWLLDTAEEHQAAALLLRRFQRSIQVRAAERGWHVDNTADLARILRPTGTLNHKTTPPKPVTILHEDAIRYNPSDIAETPWLATIEDTYTPSTTRGEFPPTLMQPIVDGCAWLQHCRDDAATLSEPAWYGMLGIIGRCVEGPQIAHEWSTPYPRYDQNETTKKLTHALDHGPLTCSTIRYDKGGDEYCRDCQCWGTIKSPIVLGMPRTPRQEAQRRRGDSSGEGDGMQTAPETPTLPWPQMPEEAYYGLAGEIVRTIEPHTESDPVAILVQLLAMVGNVIGRTAYFPIEAGKHYMNLFVCLVGDSAKSRKGTSAGHARRVLTTLDDAWSSRLMGGLSSGEGVIWHVRDAVYGKNKKGEEVCLDEGAKDKRLCILETEFARALTKMGQEGNVLSAVLREAWDHGELRTLVSGRQKAPVQSTNAHISVIAHITVEELQRLLTATESANGFGNRFLWCCVRRSKLLPRGGKYPEQALRPLTQQLARAVFHARTIAQMERTEAAEARWDTIYTSLADGYSGLLGAITARGEPHVARLSCLYALLDETNTVDVSHLDAAYAIWRYCEASAKYLFGATLGNPLADDIVQMLRQMGADGMTRTDINNALGRHFYSADIVRALTLLQREGYAKSALEKTAGRPVERWVACSPFSVRTTELSEKSERRSEGDTLYSHNSLNSVVHIEKAEYEEGVI